MASLVTARRDAIGELIQDWTPGQHAELAELCTRLAQQVNDEPVPATGTAA